MGTRTSPPGITPNLDFSYPTGAVGGLFRPYLQTADTRIPPTFSVVLYNPLKSAVVCFH